MEYFIFEILNHDLQNGFEIVLILMTFKNVIFKSFKIFLKNL
jgi:hypothetical protein